MAWCESYTAVFDCMTLCLHSFSSSAFSPLGCSLRGGGWRGSQPIACLRLTQASASFFLRHHAPFQHTSVNLLAGLLAASCLPVPPSATSHAHISNLFLQQNQSCTHLDRIRTSLAERVAGSSSSRCEWLLLHEGRVAIQTPLVVIKSTIFVPRSHKHVQRTGLMPEGPNRNKVKYFSLFFFLLCITVFAASVRIDETPDLQCGKWWRPCGSGGLLIK